MPVTLEICVDDLAGLDAAIAGGADRIELCAALSVGGLTPAPGLIAAAATRPVPVYAMIRPRAGNFVFSPAELDMMRAEIDAVRAAGLAGVVLGASLPDGRLDGKALETLTRHAQGLGLTLHRAFDLVPDFPEAIDLAVELGFERILTSGGAPTAEAGIAPVGAIAAHAGGRIAIMPGSGVNAGNAGLFLSRLGVTELHASGSAPRPVGDRRLIELGFAPATIKTTDTQTVAALKSAIAAAITD